MNLKQKTLKGVAWSALERVLGQGLQFTITVLLVRLLTPEDFGLIAMLMVFIGFATIFSDFGLGSALVQHQRVSPEQINSVFWINLLLGLLTTSVFFFSSPFLASFYDAPRLEPLSRVLSFLFVLSTPGIVPRALLTKALAFDRLAKIEISAISFAGITAVLLALTGWGVWALVVQSLIREIIRSLLGTILVDWRPRVSLSISAARDFLRYSTNLSGFQIINYFARNSDNLLIGKYLSVTSLGFYTRAYSILLLPVGQIIGVLTQVMFPTLSSIQHDKVRVRDVYLRAMRVISFVVYPIMLGLLVTAHPFVMTLFGARWITVTPLIQIFSLVSLTQSLCNPTGWIYMSQGRTDWMFRWGIFASTTLVGAIAAGVYIGSIQHVAWAYLIANLFLTYPCIAIPGKLIQMKFMDVIRVAAPSFICASIMAVLVWAIGAALPDKWHTSIHLVLQTVSGFIIYLTLARCFHLHAYTELCRISAEHFSIRIDDRLSSLASLGVRRYRRITQK